MSTTLLEEFATALFAALPQKESAFAWQGETYGCTREILETSEPGRFVFVEVWHDPERLQAVHQWRTLLNMGAWVGLSAIEQHRIIETFVRQLDRIRPVLHRRSTPTPFLPSTFGHRPKGQQ